MKDNIDIKTIQDAIKHIFNNYEEELTNIHSIGTYYDKIQILALDINEREFKNTIEKIKKDIKPFELVIEERPMATFC
jgi:hypothetical protein